MLKFVWKFVRWLICGMRTVKSTSDEIIQSNGEKVLTNHINELDLKLGSNLKIIPCSNDSINDLLFLTHNRYSIKVVDLLYLQNGLDLLPFLVFGCILQFYGTIILSSILSFELFLTFCWLSMTLTSMDFVEETLNLGLLIHWCSLDLIGFTE